MVKWLRTSRAWKQTKSTPYSVVFERNDPGDREFKRGSYRVPPRI
jgi:hypothetical protein